MDPGSDLLNQNPDIIQLSKDGSPQSISFWNSYYMSPGYQKTIDHTKGVLKLHAHISPMLFFRFVPVAVLCRTLLCRIQTRQCLPTLHQAGKYDLKVKLTEHYLETEHTMATMWN